MNEPSWKCIPRPIWTTTAPATILTSALSDAEPEPEGKNTSDVLTLKLRDSKYLLF